MELNLLHAQGLVLTQVLRQAQAEKQAEKEAQGYWDQLIGDLKEGKLNTYARLGG